MKKYKLKDLIFMALCCDLGMFSKGLILPLVNFITALLHIPGGIATSFSLMFLVIGAAVLPGYGAGTIMGVIQSGLALVLGMTGSMGLLAPISYITPGIVIDLVLYLTKKRGYGIVVSSMAASLTACLVTNLISHKLSGIFLLQYALIATCSGAVCGLLALLVVKGVTPFFKREDSMPQTEGNS